MSGFDPGETLRRAGRRLARSLLTPQLPLLAVEVRPRAVSAVRLSLERGKLALGAAASGELPPGALEVSLTKSNLVDPEAFDSALRSVLERVGALAGGPVSLVLPDPVVRLTLLPANGMRGRRREVDETVRFRLHKALPFDVRQARLAWDGAAGEQMLVAVSPDEVVRGYEEALAKLGHQTGLIEAAGLALAAAAFPEEAPGDRLLVNWDEGYVSFLLLRGGRPLLVRTLPGEDGVDAVERQAGGTLQFYRDRLQGQQLAEVVVRSAAQPGEAALAVLERALGVSPRLVEPWAPLGIAEQDPAAQAVAGAAACALRRAA